MYELVLNTIRILPMFVMAAVFIYLLRIKWYFRSAFMVLIGWITLIIFVYLYWWYAFNFSPTQEIQNKVALKDSGPRSAVLIIGWAYSLAFYLFLEVGMVLASILKRLFKAA